MGHTMTAGWFGLLIAPVLCLVLWTKQGEHLLPLKVCPHLDRRSVEVHRLSVELWTRLYGLSSSDPGLNLDRSLESEFYISAVH